MAGRCVYVPSVQVLRGEVPPVRRGRGGQVRGGRQLLARLEGAVARPLSQRAEAGTPGVPERLPTGAG